MSRKYAALMDKVQALIEDIFEDDIEGDTVQSIPGTVAGADASLLVHLKRGTIAIAFKGDRAVTGTAMMLADKTVVPLHVTMELSCDADTDFQGWAYQAKTAYDIFLEGSKNYEVEQGQFGLANNTEFRKGQTVEVYRLADCAALRLTGADRWHLMALPEFDAMVAMKVLVEK